MVHAQQEHKDDDGSTHPVNDDVVDLIVGGYPYRTTRNVLLSSPFISSGDNETETYFHALLSGRWKRTKTEQPIQIQDQDGRLFFYVLYYLQLGQLPRDVHCSSKRSLLSSEDISGLESQADFFGLTGLAKLCQAIQENPTGANDTSDDSVVWDGTEKRLGNNEYLLKKSGDTGYLTKLLYMGVVPYDFSKWGSGTVYKLTEKYRSGWSIVGYRHGIYGRSRGVLRHPFGFTVEVTTENIDQIIKNNTIEKGEIQGKWKWVGGNRGVGDSGGRFNRICREK